MKIRTFRMSNLPVYPADLQAHRQEWTTEFDKLEKEFGTDMLKMQEHTQKLADELSKKYQYVVELEFPKTRKAMAKLIDELEAPILFARSSENPKELVLVVMDVPM